MTDDFQWVREYVEHGSDDAFRELVRRHTPLVFGTARPLLDNSAMAEEVTQAVFILLSRKAGQLRHGTILAGWLYRTTRFVAREAIRQETRRARRQGSFMLMNTSTEVMWQKIEPILDEALDALGRHVRAHGGRVGRHVCDERLRQAGAGAAEHVAEHPHRSRGT